MKRMTIVAVGLGLLLSGLNTAAAQQKSPCHCLIPKLNWVRFEVSLGRIQLSNLKFVKTKSHTVGNPLVGVRQTLVVTASSIPALHYESVNPDRLLLVDMQGTELTIQQQPQGDSGLPRIEYRQPRRGKITLTVAQSESPAATYSADSIWHLLLGERMVCRRHLLPLLEQLRPNWQLAATADRVEDALFRVSQSGWIPQRELWATLVKKLGDGSFRERQVADRQLRLAGQALLSFLDDLDPQTLDAEQRMRIRRIKQSLMIGSGDQPARVASWLIDDKAVWVTLLSHPDPQKRSAAVAHLNRVCKRTVDFDPYADTAERRQQLERLAGGLRD